MRKLLSVGIGVVLLVGASACGGGGGGSKASGFDVKATCIGSPRSELGLDAKWRLCSDSGFLPREDSFSFENYGGPVSTDAVTVATAIALFGEQAVCSSGSGPNCRANPSALQWIETSNAQLEGGRCEGMAVESKRIEEGRDSPSSLQSGAARAADLKITQPTVGQSIARWWATQTYPEVQRAASASRRSDPRAIAGEVAAALGRKDGVTMGIYWAEGGHSLTPVAVAWDGTNTIRVLVYDSNFPGELRPLDIDQGSGKWTYENARLNSSTSSGSVSGGKGTLEFTPMKVREESRTAPWMVSTSEGGTKGSTAVVFSTRGRAPIDLRIETDSESFLASSLLASPRDGFDYRPNLGARASFGTGGSLTIESDDGRVRVTTVIGDPFEPTSKVPVILAVDPVGPTSMLTRAEIDPESELSAEVSVGDDAQSVQIDSDGTAFDVEFVAGDDVHEFSLPGGNAFSFTDPDDAGFELAVESDSGAEVWSDTLGEDFGDPGAVSREYDFDLAGLQRILDSMPSWDSMDEAAWDAFAERLDQWLADFEQQLGNMPDPVADPIPDVMPGSTSGEDEGIDESPTTTVADQPTAPEAPEDTAPPTAAPEDE